MAITVNGFEEAVLYGFLAFRITNANGVPAKTEDENVSVALTVFALEYVQDTECTCEEGVQAGVVGRTISAGNVICIVSPLTIGMLGMMVAV